MAYLPGTHEKRFITVERGRAKRDRAKRDDRGEDTWARVVMPGDNPDTRQKLLTAKRDSARGYDRDIWDRVLAQEDNRKGERKALSIWKEL